MGLSSIKIQPEIAVQILDNCIISGYRVKDEINEDYFQDKSAVDREKVSKWRIIANKWVNECLQKLGVIFISQKQLYDFRDAPSSPLVQVNTNIDWNAIINFLEARINKLKEYDKYIREEFNFNVKLEVVGRDKIVQLGNNSQVKIENEE